MLEGRFAVEACLAVVTSAMAHTTAEVVDMMVDVAVLEARVGVTEPEEQPLVLAKQSKAAA